MSASDGAKSQNKSGGTSTTPKDGRGPGFTQESLEHIPCHSKGFEAYAVIPELKFIKFSPNSGLQEVTQAIDKFYTSRFEDLDALREERGLKPSLPLELKVKSETVKDYEYIRDALEDMEGVWKCVGHSPPFLTEGNVLVPSLFGGKLTSEFEKHEASGSK